MKPVKNSFFTALLVCLFAFRVLGGDIQTPGAVAPPPPPTNVTVTSSEATLQSSDPNYEQSGDIDTSDYLFDALAALLTLY
jgi:hypothetical protein